ncbi:FKBP-type peptidyl-prolyl cis-trans isomerase [candidate division GN15 bacterium]|nr:FKBP-type peptidyl-prolyl cis-trans isomerase [candidate division GN15 bacterium]
MRQLFVILFSVAFLAAGSVLAGDTTKTTDKPASVKDVQAKQAESGEKKAEAAKDEAVEWNENESGLKWVDLETGDGEPAEQGDQVEVHYHLWLAGEDGSKAKSVQHSRDPNPRTGEVQTFKFKVGDGRLIKGWNEGMIGMKPGGVRRLMIPPKIGYGSKAVGGMIPANSTLIFEIELLGYPNK